MNEYEWWVYQQQNNPYYWNSNSTLSPVSLEQLRGTQQQKVERTDSMLHTIVVTETPSPIDQQNGKSERLVAGPETILAKNGNEAIAIFGAKNAEAILAASPDRMTVLIRAGV